MPGQDRPVGERWYSHPTCPYCHRPSTAHHSEVRDIRRWAYEASSPGVVQLVADLPGSDTVKVVMYRCGRIRKAS